MLFQSKVPSMFLYISDIVEETHLRVSKKTQLESQHFYHTRHKQREGKKSSNLLLPIRFWECDFDQLS
jgi:hypothetical protein